MPRLSTSQLGTLTPRGGDPLSTTFGHNSITTAGGDGAHRSQQQHHRSPSAASRAKPDILTGIEKARIERAFYKAGPLTSAAAAEAVFASFGWELTTQERLRWFPDDDDPLSGEPRRQPNPVALHDVLQVMRSKKEEYLAFAADGDNETLSMFVSLGGAVDGSGHADIASLIEAVQRLRGEIPKRRSTLAAATHRVTSSLSSHLIRKSTLAALPSHAQDVSRAFDDGDCVEGDGDDDGELSTEHTSLMMAGSTSADQMLATQLKTMPRIVNYAAFTDALQLLRTAATGTAGQSAVRGANTNTNNNNNTTSFCTPGTPTDGDMVPSPSSGPQHRQSVANVASLLTMVDNVAHQWGGNRPPRGSVMGASGVLRHSAGSSGGVGGGGGAKVAGGMDDDVWSVGDDDDDVGDTHRHAVDADNSTSDACHRLRQAISSCVQSFHNRQPPESALRRITALPPSGMTPMSMDGTSLAELLAERKQRARKTKPITPTMMLRDKAKEELLLLETQRLVDARLHALLDATTKKQKTTQKTNQKETKKNGGPSREGAAAVSPSGPLRRREPRADDGPNEFVESLAKHVAYLERTNRPASACCVRPAARQARNGAPRLVESWKRRSVGKLVEAREKALELAIADLPPPHVDDDISVTHADATSVAASLQPPVMGFERPARATTPDVAARTKGTASRVSPFLAYPHPGVYRNPFSGEFDSKLRAGK